MKGEKQSAKRVRRRSASAKRGEDWKPGKREQAEEYSPFLACRPGGFHRPSSPLRHHHGQPLTGPGRDARKAALRLAAVGQSSRRLT